MPLLAGAGCAERPTLRDAGYVAAYVGMVALAAVTGGRGGGLEIGPDSNFDRR